jgi:hypothetical protein
MKISNSKFYSVKSASVTGSHINPLENTFLLNICNPAPTSQETCLINQPINATRETIAVCCENTKKHTNTLCEQDAGFIMLMHVKHLVPRTKK